jgi:hypothetical protein
MTEWSNRPQEQRALLNPAFCAALLWYAAQERKGTGQFLSFEECFLVLPLVLPASTRDALPSTAATSIPVWLEAHPLEQRRLVTRSRLMVPFTRAAIQFGASRGAIRIENGLLMASERWKSKVKSFTQNSSDEVRACAGKSRFISKWFLKTGSPTTVLTILGVRP